MRCSEKRKQRKPFIYKTAQASDAITCSCRSKFCVVHALSASMQRKMPNVPRKKSECRVNVALPLNDNEKKALPPPQQRQQMTATRAAVRSHFYYQYSTFRCFPFSSLFTAAVTSDKYTLAWPGLSSGVLPLWRTLTGSNIRVCVCEREREREREREENLFPFLAVVFRFVG